MKYGLIICAIVLSLLSATGVALADDYSEYDLLNKVPENAHAVTDKILSVEAIAPYLLELYQGSARLTIIWGIHQEGNQATVYYQIRTQNDGLTRNMERRWVRFTSGLWYDPVSKKAIMYTKQT